MANDINKWHVVNVHYVKAEKYVTLLPPQFSEFFVPPVVTNMLFIRSSYQAIYDYIRFNADGRRMSFMRDGLTMQPIVVKDSDMEIFMRICSACTMPIVMNEMPTVKLGSLVRVKEGPLKGLEGHVVRIRKNRRILVNISNVLWAATEFIHPELLEVIEENKADNVEK